jgi:hypothetical protein
MLAPGDVQVPGSLPALVRERGSIVRPRTSKCRWAPLECGDVSMYPSLYGLAASLPLTAR